ncbi:MAG: diguanylate cyclase [Candidatus Aminicenantes bacterium]|nr:diguanylate cyclase [Candidatus Aminicenantes bacterium]
MYAFLRQGALCGGILRFSAHFLAFFLPFLGLPLFAQENLLFRRYSIDHGLSQNSVYAIVQDRQGFMWFATQDGLNRFDGYTFRVFHPKPGDRTTLSNGFVTALAEDGRGYLWAGTDNGNLNRYDPASETFRHFRPVPGSPPRGERPIITSLLADSQGRLWVGTSQGLARFDPDKETFSLFRNAPEDPASLSGNSISVIYESPKGNFWVGTQDAGLNRFDPAGGRAVRHLDGASVRAVLEDDGLLWVGTDDGLVRFDPRTGRSEVFRNDPSRPESLIHNRITSLIKDQNDDIWIGTHGGLERWDGDSGRFVHFKNDIADVASLADDDVLSLGLDGSGGLWVGTQGGGLSRLDRVSVPFEHLRDRSEIPNRRSRNQIWSIMENGDGTLWIGTAAGLHLFNRRTGFRFNYESDPRRPGGLSQDIVRSVIKDRRGSVWVGTEGMGIDRLDPGAKTFRHYRYDPDDSGSLSSNEVRYLLEGRDGSIWVATLGGGVNRFDRATGRFVRYVHDPNDESSLSVNRTYSLCEDREGFLWVATWGGGVSRLDPATGRCVHYRHNPADPTSLSDNSVLSVMEDRAGNIWVGTRGAGLCRLAPQDREKGKFLTISENDGLPNNQIYSVLEDEAGCLWLTSNRGLSRLDPSTGKIKNFHLQSGVQSPEFNGNAKFKSPSGEMFFGGINGLNAFFPGRIKDNPYPPPVVLTGLQIFNRPVAVGPDADGRTILERSITQAPAVRLSHEENTIILEFAALHYAVPEENRYAYILEGFDKEWHDVGRNRSATYTNLPPGRYVFRVRASNNDGLWNEEGAALAVIVTPPFWRRFWFQALAVLSALALAAGAVGRRVWLQAQNRRHLKAMVEERTAELQSANRRLQEEIAERQRLMGELQRLSVTDELTGLYNRRGFQTFGGELLKMGRRINARVFTLYVDFDRLKSHNDRFGHSEGDKALLDLAAVLTQAFRETDIVARVGGDEFAVLGILDQDSSVEILTERLQHLLKEHNDKLDTSRRISLSIGTVSRPIGEAVGIDDLLQAADAKMYEQKRLKN